jgi:hypothetical protein
MQSKFMAIIVSASVAGISAITALPAISATQYTEERDPARWFSEDMTPQGRYQTSKKEAGAAYQEMTAACKQTRGAERSACMKEATANFQSDMAAAKKLLAR